MKNWSRLILPLGLGALAAIINASAMTARLVPIELVSVNRNIDAGEKIEDADLTKVLVNHPSGHLKDHFWLWEKRNQLLHSVGTPVPLAKGQLVSKADYANLGRNLFTIRPDFALIGVRCTKDAIVDRHQVIPGRSITLKYDTAAHDFKQFEVAFVEPIQSADGENKFYQIGILVPKSKFDRDKGLVETLLSSSPYQVVGH